jgi:adenine-specific DNA-methyltransferase
MEIGEEIAPFINELPTDYADRLGISYANAASSLHKKTKGQFFTPTAIARLMASFSNNQESKIRILDPGCGTAILTCALIETLVKNNPTLTTIDITAYETDIDLISFSEQSLSYLKSWTREKGIEFNYVLYVDDFILDNSKYIQEHLYTQNINREFFDIIISNPPYFKLSKDDLRTKAAQIVISGQPNIYSIFMAIAAKLLSDNGELIFITPRSFASGNYFKAFREFFFQAVEIENIHLFVSRKDTFDRDSVLQETVIMKGTKANQQNTAKKILVSSSHGIKDIESPSVKSYKPEDLIDFKTKEKMLHLPTNDAEEEVVNLFRSWSGSLNKYNIQISTGPVVSFRVRSFIYDVYENSTVFLCPLFWLHNVNKMSLDWPNIKPNKGQYIRILDESRSILIPNKDYIFLRRFSTKDDKSRLIAAPYFHNFTKSDFIGVENKVNYIYRPMGHLEKNEIIGLCALLNSNLFDTYFRTFNGNVNVSATELREMSLPPLETIKEIGDRIIISNNYTVDHINDIVKDFFVLNMNLIA